MTLAEINERENELFRYWGGSIPEANSEFNDLQCKKIEAVHKQYGTAYIGRVNIYDDMRNEDGSFTVYEEYVEQMVFNFGADFIVPVKDELLADMIREWNSGKLSTSLELIEKITHRIVELGGANLMWS